ncbi:26S proteasome non-ATPase regulatory subunit 13 [Balamuthia mandrillaris]
MQAPKEKPETKFLEEYCNSKLGDRFAEIKAFHEKRLWHNLTVKLLELVEQPEMKEDNHLLRLYEEFMRTFENKINQLSFAQIIVTIAKAHKDLNEAISFLDTMATKLSANKESPAPYLLLRSVQAQYLLLRTETHEQAAELLDSIEKSLETATGIDTSVYSNFYRAKADLQKLKGRPAEYYKNAMLFLSYMNLEALPAAEKEQLAYELGLAALIGEDLYNFGDLIAHPIFESLLGTGHEWLAHFLRAFNAGDIEKYEALVAQYNDRLSKEEGLVRNSELLKEKISILCLMELVFNRKAMDRNIPFNVIAEATKLPIDVVELLIMKSLSLKLLRGQIDQLTQTVNVTWVQPRVLGMEQISTMKDRLDDWTKKVHDTLLLVEQGTPELLS